MHMLKAVLDEYDIHDNSSQLTDYNLLNKVLTGNNQKWMVKLSA